METNKTIFDYQQYFNIDLNDLIKQDEDNIEYLKQNHFGDLLIEKYEENQERYKLWRNLDCNIDEGEPLIQIEYSGKYNNHTWETIAEYNN